jgi:hypothetical protein
MVKKSASPPNLSDDILAETVQQASHVFSVTIGPAIKTVKNAPKNEPVIIMPEMANTVICPDTCKSLKHQKLITRFRYNFHRV